MTASLEDRSAERHSPEGVEVSAFRGELRRWLEEHPPPVVDGAATAADAEILRSWHRTLHDGRWVGVNWPVEYGGRGATLAELAVYNEELARVNAPQLLGRVGVSLVGPTLVAHGTVAQRDRWMPRILAGEDIWCQLFSEPEAGSDLASLSTRADRHGEAYVVGGQKVWSSLARWANWGLALVRTDPTAARHRGISMLAIPMTTDGVEVRPLRQITGDSEFNEVFLEGVEVPRANLVGPEHGGWAVANTTLANERGATFIWKEQVLHELAIRRLWRRCRRSGRFADPVVRQELAQAWMEVEILRLHNARTLTRLDRGESIGPEASLVKLWWAGMSQRLADAAVGVLGPEALLMPEDRLALDGGRWAQAVLATRANSIMGGTSEIQRTILGEQLLGLPREPSR